MGSLNAEDYVVDTFPFGSGPTLLLYTDGAVEARNDDGQFYDLGAHVAAWPGSRPEELLQHVLDGLSVHVGGGAITARRRHRHDRGAVRRRVLRGCRAPSESGS